MPRPARSYQWSAELSGGDEGVRQLVGQGMKGIERREKSMSRSMLLKLLAERGRL
jgi:hypothetical protein